MTIDGVPYPLPQPFLLCATQNPIEYEGTYPLPEAQLDRFMIKVESSYPQRGAGARAARARRRPASTRARWKRRASRRSRTPPKCSTRSAPYASVHLSDGVREYAYRIVAATRSHPRLTLGASPRAGIAAARRIAGRGRDRGPRLRDARRRQRRRRLRHSASSDRRARRRDRRHLGARRAARDPRDVPVPRGDAAS